MKNQSLMIAPQQQLRLMSADQIRFDEQLRREVVEILARLLVSAIPADADAEVADEAP
jgi:hypothetical protein